GCSPLTATCAEVSKAVTKATTFITRKRDCGVIPRLAEKIRKPEGIRVGQNPILSGTDSAPETKACRLIAFERKVEDRPPPRGQLQQCCSHGARSRCSCLPLKRPP